MDADQQERLAELEAQAAGPGLSDAEANELGQLYAAKDGTGYANAEAVHAGATGDAEADPRLDAAEVERIKAELHDGTIEDAQKAAYTKREAFSNMYGGAFQVHEGEEDIQGRHSG